MKISKTVIATLFVAGKVRTWMVKRATSPFNSFCSNVALNAALKFVPLFYGGLSRTCGSPKNYFYWWSMFQDKQITLKNIA